MGGTRGNAPTNINAVRKSIGNQTDSMRVRLAELVGMPFSELVARIDTPSDPNMARRVIETINPSHREGVAKLLLSVQPGSDRDLSIYPLLDAIFRGGDPFASNAVLARELGQQPPKLQNSMYSLTYRAWLTIGLVSDRPSSMPADITKAFESIKPNAAKQAGERQLTRAFTGGAGFVESRHPAGVEQGFDGSQLPARNQSVATANLRLGCDTRRLGPPRVDPHQLQFERLAHTERTDDAQHPKRVENRPRRGGGDVARAAVADAAAIGQVQKGAFEAPSH